MSNITEFNLPKNSYASFDAQSMRDLIIERLNQDSSISFTDQNFQGSNLNAIIDIIGFSFHTLLFYLNQTSSEGTFSDTQLYENMNRIVKLIDYKPAGPQTSIVPMTINALAGLSTGYHTVPRFTFATVNGKTYTNVGDITFNRQLSSTTETISAIDNTLFYEGRIQEYPVETAIGEDFEIVNILPGANTLIDHFNIFVFVKEGDTWYEYTRTPSLFLNNGTQRVFDVRYNQNKNYEVKFGNNINGKRLSAGDSVAVYYLESTGTQGQITKNAFNSSQINVYNTTQYDEIFDDIKDSTLSYLSIDDITDVVVSNSEDSTLYDSGETVDDIRTNAPKFFSSEYKLITKPDYESFISRNFSNIIYDIKVSNNADYTGKFLSYMQNELGLESYKDQNNALYNQVLYSDNFDINNLYVTIVPKFKRENTVVTRSNYITPALKTEILNKISDYKLLNGEIVFLDPVYLAVNFALRSGTEQFSTNIIDSTELVIERNTNAIANDETIRTKVYNVIVNYFNAAKLGQTIDIKELNSDIQSIPGVDAFYMNRKDINLKSYNLSLSFHNPIYNGKDFYIADSNHVLEYFQIPFIENIQALKDNIVVRAVAKSNVTIEY